MIKPPASNRRPAPQNDSSKAHSKKLHSRNSHNNGYDFALLLESTPSLRPFLIAKSDSALSLDFANPHAVRALNSALLKSYYAIEYWTLPEGALCPPIPGRVDYIHHIADLLNATLFTKRQEKHNTSRKRQSGKGKRAFKLLDIGTGASGIYGLLAAQHYGWECVGSDINPESLANVSKIIEQNPALSSRFSVREQTDKGSIFKGIIREAEHFDVSVCNPPFHDSPSAAEKAARRKTTNLRKNNDNSKAKLEPKLNFGGQDAELWCNGGERLFLKRMIKESKEFAGQCGWFTSLVSKSENLTPAIKQLNKLNAKDVRTIAMHQGNKKTRILAWTFQEITTKN